MHYTENQVTTHIRIDDIIVEFKGHICQQLVLYINITHGYKLYIASRPLVPLFLGGRSHIGASQQKRKEDSQILSFHVQLYRWLPLLNNCRLSDIVDRIYLIEFEIKDTVDTYNSASYLDLLLKIHSEWCLRTELYDKKDNYNLPIVNFPCIRGCIRAPPGYGVYTSQLIRYSRACGSNKDFLDRRLLLTAKLLNQGFLLVELILSLRKFDGSHHGLVNRYGIAVSQMTTDIPCVSYTLFVLSSFMTYYRVCIYHYVTSGTSGAGNDNPSGAHTFSVGFMVFHL